MVTSIYATVAPSRNHASPTPAAPAPRPAAGSDPSAQALLLAAAQCPTVTLSHLVAAIPDHPSPLSAVMALVDDGLLVFDPQDPFGGDLAFWSSAA